MDCTAEDLASYLVQQLKLKAVGERLLVAIAGVPASGKSTLAELVVAKVNTLLAADSATHSTSTILVGLDRWHLSRAQLDAMSDPKLAHHRRGAHWTFDGPSYVEFAKLLRQPSNCCDNCPFFRSCPERSYPPRCVDIPFPPPGRNRGFILNLVYHGPGEIDAVLPRLPRS